MDIRSRRDYPAGALTNFMPYEFEIDGIKCASMEGFLQSLKTDDPIQQATVCRLIGKEAKLWGEQNNAAWTSAQMLWWQGRAYGRHSQEYQKLLDRAYEALFKNIDFRNALLATGQENLTHSIGRSDPRETILTEEEFCSRLMKLRRQIK